MYRFVSKSINYQHKLTKYLTNSQNKRVLSCVDEEKGILV